MREARIGRAVVVGEITIIPLERVSVYYDSNKGGLLAYISKEPIGVVISSPQGKWAADVRGCKVALETYIQEVPALRDVLDSPEHEKENT